jgi:hypothetical protein
MGERLDFAGCVRSEDNCRSFILIHCGAFPQVEIYDVQP